MLRNCLGLVLVAFAASPAAGQKWAEGDYGPVLSTHMDVWEHVLQDTTNLADTRNYVFRGRLISLNDGKTANVVYDTEHMRVAGFWTGGYVKWKGAFKNMGPSVDGDLQVITRPGPGWSKDADWADPRESGEGPLPADWTKYEGMYRHGNKIVLEYTVGDCRVLEMPELRAGNGISALVRRFTMGPSKKPLGMLLCESPGASGEVASLGDHDLGVLRTTDGHEIVASAVGMPEGTKFETEEGRLHLLLPSLSGSASFDVVIARLEPKQREAFTGLLGETPIDVTRFIEGGPPLWPDVVRTKGKRAEDDQAYVVDELTPPDDNPWNSWIRFGGFDFFGDGRAAITTWDGDVWVVSGIDDDLEDLQWRRFATGLHHPLGLKIVDDTIYVAGRDQVTVLRDLNGDGEADAFENFNNDPGLTLQRHEYVMDLQTDAEGNFYYCRSGHYVKSKRGDNCCVYKLSPDGETIERFAWGFREPNGMSIGPKGLMTVADNEGNGVPQTPLYHLQEGKFYGFVPQKWEHTEPPILWLPKNVDQSAGGQVWVESDRWGPLKGELLHTSYGHCRLFHVMLQQVDGVWQGAATRFPLLFGSGIMRGRFRKQDGQLYVCGLRGWGSAAAREATFARVRYTGKPFYQPTGFAVTEAGVELEFAVPLDRDSTEDDQNWAVSWHDAYRVPGRRQQRKEDLFVDLVTLSEDGKTVSIELEEVQPVTNLTIEYRIRAADGTKLSDTVWGTINAVP